LPARSACNVDDGLYVYVAVQVDVWVNVNVNLNGHDPAVMPSIDSS
jgi:hypothetical protein